MRKMFTGKTNLMMGKLVDCETVDEFLLVVESIGKHIGKSERDKKYQGQ